MVCKYDRIRNISKMAHISHGSLIHLKCDIRLIIRWCANMIESDTVS